MMQRVPNYSQAVQQKHLAKVDEKVDKGKLQLKKGTADDGNFNVTSDVMRRVLATSSGKKHIAHIAN